MSLKGKLEAIIYAAEEPVTFEQMAHLLKDEIVSEENLAAEGFELNAQVRARLRAALDELVAEYAAEHRGMEIRQIAGGYRVATKPQYHDAVRLFAKSLKPPIRLSLQALETLSVIAYKQPVTVPEISEIRGVDSSGVIATLLERKLITTAGRKAVIGRPILYKTTREFLMRFGLKDVGELPSLEEFEKLAGEAEQPGLFPAGSVADATGVPDLPAEAAARPATESSSDETAGAAEASHAPTPVPEKVSHE